MARDNDRYADFAPVMIGVVLVIGLIALVLGMGGCCTIYGLSQDMGNAAKAVGSGVDNKKEK